MNTPRHQSDDILCELMSGVHYGAFVDDSGSPGLVTPGLHQERKTWVAVLVPPAQMAEVLEQIPNALGFLEELGLSDPEFHFADIWAGKGEFEKLDLQKRIAIFRFMAFIFSHYRFDILVQTFDPDQAANLTQGLEETGDIGPLKLTSHEDLALVTLLGRLKRHVRLKCGQTATACVVIDEGRLRAGHFFVHDGFLPTFTGGRISFESSRVMKPIQLADFAAYSLNRSQLLRVKPKLTELDKTFLKAVEPLTELYLNIDTVRLHDLPNIKNVRGSMN